MRPRAVDSADDGQATVEAALVLPVVVIVVVLVLQVGLLVRDQVLVTHGAGEGARVASIEGDAEAAVAAVRASTGLDPARLTVDVDGRLESGDRVTVEVSYRSPTVIPLVRSVAASVEVRATVTVRIE